MSFTDRLVNCPECGRTVEAPEHMSDYDWASGVSENGLAEIACVHCGHSIAVEARAEIYSVEVLDD